VLDDPIIILVIPESLSSMSVAVDGDQPTSGDVHDEPIGSTQHFDIPESISRIHGRGHKKEILSKIKSASRIIFSAIGIMHKNHNVLESALR